MALQGARREHTHPRRGQGPGNLGGGASRRLPFEHLSLIEDARRRARRLGADGGDQPGETPGVPRPKPAAQAQDESTGATPVASGGSGVAHRDTTWHTGLMADHCILRLAAGTKQRLADRAHHAGVAERTLAQRYVEEGLRHDVRPLIQFLDDPSGRRASLVGRGLDVWEVIATVQDNSGSIADATEYLQIPAGLVEAAVAYYGEYRH